MRGGHKIVGFDRKIELDWLDATAGQVAHGASPEEVRAFLWKMLEGSVSAGSSGFNSDRGKTITVLVHVWSDVPEALRPLRERALKLLHDVSASERIAVHWAMCLATYPFFREVASTVGRLTKIQPEVTLADLHRRLAEQWGDRDITRRASQRIVRSLVSWGALRDADKRGVYRRGTAQWPVDGVLAEVLIEGLLAGNERHSLPGAQIATHPALFPFRVEFSVAELRRSPRFQVDRQGLDTDLVRLANGARRQH